MNKVIELMGFDSSANVAAAAPEFSLADFEAEFNRASKAIAKIDENFAREMATLEFLDLRYKDVKVSKRVAKVPKYARGITK